MYRLIPLLCALLLIHVAAGQTIQPGKAPESQHTEIDAQLAALDVGGSLAGLPTIIPITQHRFTSTLVSFPVCATTVVDGEKADGFEPFSSSLQSEDTCEGNWVGEFVAQESVIEPTSMSGFGDALIKAAQAPESPVVAMGLSSFEVTFEVPTTSDFTFLGIMHAWGVGGAPIVQPGAFMTIVGPGPGVVFDAIVSPGPNGEGITVEVDESGVLSAGLYTLVAAAHTGGDDVIVGHVIGSASFDFIFEVSSKFDLPGDMDADGDVDRDDYMVFRECFTGSGGGPIVGVCVPGDFDGDGDIDFDDLEAFRDAYTG